jgi:alkanesulfonate monooxygenase SsuD/methylene tetrahydromethanopterin reductase-like flavin-dependent oxidoreductase (luciferase family)
MSTSQRGLSLFVQVRGGGRIGELYSHGLRLAQRADRLGYDTIWVATRHFGSNEAILPSVFPYLAAVAANTSNIRLGSGVVPLPFHDPIHVVEQAAVVDHLSGGRIELGIGKGLGFGLSATSYAAFGVAGSDRETLYELRLRRLREALHGSISTPAGAVALSPTPRDLAYRLWQSTGNVATARDAGAAGDGLLPHENSEAVAGNSVDAIVGGYLNAWKGADSPRIGLTVYVLPVSTREEARRTVEADAAIHPAFYAAAANGGVSNYLDKNRVLVGNPDDLGEQISEMLRMRPASHLLFHIPLAIDHPDYDPFLGILARDVFPRLRDQLL